MATAVDAHLSPDSSRGSTPTRIRSRPRPPSTLIVSHGRDANCINYTTPDEKAEQQMAEDEGETQLLLENLTNKYSLRSRKIALNEKISQSQVALCHEKTSQCRTALSQEKTSPSQSTSGSKSPTADHTAIKSQTIRRLGSVRHKLAVIKDKQETDNTSAAMQNCDVPLVLDCDNASITFKVTDNEKSSSINNLLTTVTVTRVSSDVIANIADVTTHVSSDIHANDNGSAFNNTDFIANITDVTTNNNETTRLKIPECAGSNKTAKTISGHELVEGNQHVTADEQQKRLGEQRAISNYVSVPSYVAVETNETALNIQYPTCPGCDSQKNNITAQLSYSDKFVPVTSGVRTVQVTTDVSGVRSVIPVTPEGRDTQAAFSDENKHLLGEIRNPSHRTISDSDDEGVTSDIALSFDDTYTTVMSATRKHKLPPISLKIKELTLRTDEPDEEGTKRLTTVDTGCSRQPISDSGSKTPTGRFLTHPIIPERGSMKDQGVLDTNGFSSLHGDKHDSAAAGILSSQLSALSLDSHISADVTSQTCYDVITELASHGIGNTMERRSNRLLRCKSRSDPSGQKERDEVRTGEERSPSVPGIADSLDNDSLSSSSSAIHREDSLTYRNRTILETYTSCCDEINAGDSEVPRLHRQRLSSRRRRQRLRSRDDETQPDKFNGYKQTTHRCDKDSEKCNEDSEKCNEDKEKCNEDNEQNNKDSEKCNKDSEKCNMNDLERVSYEDAIEMLNVSAKATSVLDKAHTTRSVYQSDKNKLVIELPHIDNRIVDKEKYDNSDRSRDGSTDQPRDHEQSANEISLYSSLSPSPRHIVSSPERALSPSSFIATLPRVESHVRTVLQSFRDETATSSLRIPKRVTRSSSSAAAFNVNNTTTRKSLIDSLKSRTFLSSTKVPAVNENDNGSVMTAGSTNILHALQLPASSSSPSSTADSSISSSASNSFLNVTSSYSSTDTSHLKAATLPKKIHLGSVTSLDTLAAGAHSNMNLFGGSQNKKVTLFKVPQVNHGTIKITIFE